LVDLAFRPHPRWEHAEQLAQWCQRRRCRRPVTVGHGDSSPVRRRLGHGFNERGLTDPRLARDEDEAPVTGSCLVEVGAECLELEIALDEVHSSSIGAGDPGRKVKREDTALAALSASRTGHRDPADAYWTDPAGRAVLATVDALHQRADLDDAEWRTLLDAVGEDAAVDLLLLCGWYHAISFVVNALRLPAEPGTRPCRAGHDDHRDRALHGCRRRPRRGPATARRARGCLTRRAGLPALRAHRDIDNPDEFALLERSESQAAFAEHRRTPHFRRNVETALVACSPREAGQCSGQLCGATYDVLTLRSRDRSRGAEMNRMPLLYAVPTDRERCDNR
jgi:hypothetical protein